MTYVLACMIALAAGWTWGHRTARVHIVPLCTSCEADEVAILADDRARFEELVAGLDVAPPDDPRSSTT